VPTDGKPVRGLIQDHVIAAVLLTKRDTFLSRDVTCMLLSIGCASANAQRLVGGGVRPAQMHAPHGSSVQGGVKTWAEEPVPLPPPAVLKPKPLWTGKQARAPLL
jgi:DNA-directed RNA polymerase I subunit RPA1